MEEKLKSVVRRFVPDIANPRYAIVGKEGEVLASNFRSDELSRIKKLISSISGELKPGDFLLKGSRSGECLLVLKVDAESLVAIGAAGTSPGMMLACARAVMGEFKEEFKESLPPPEEKPEDIVYELSPSIGDVEKALRSVSGRSVLVRTIVANLNRGLTVRELTSGLKAAGFDITHEEVLDILRYLEALGVAKRKK